MKIFSLLLLLFISVAAAAQPVADFTADVTAVCSGENVQFSDASTGITGAATYTWNFGTGALPATATGPGPHTVTYSGSGTSTVSLTVLDEAGTDTETKLGYITVSPVPSAPVVGTITQPTCGVATGSVALSGLPSSGTWTVTRNPGAVTTPGTGTTTTISGIPSGSYTFTVTNAAGCISGSSTSAVVNTAPATPSAPIVGTITQPTCSVATGSVALSGLPSSGTWTVTRNPGGVTTPGTGTTTTISGIPSGSYTFTVTNAAGCLSGSSTSAVVNAAPATPSAPIVGTISQPTCSVAAGSVGLSGLPSAGTWTITQSPGGTTTNGTGTSTTITGLTAGSYTFTVTNNDGCTSGNSSNVTIDPAPSVPSAPVIGIITQPSCTASTGSVVLDGLPSTGSWTVTQSPGGTTGGSGSTTTISGLSEGTYSFTVTNSDGCTSIFSDDVVINAQPSTPSAPVTGSITQPDCSIPTGSVDLSGLPSSGTWTVTRIPGGNNTGGTGTSTTITGLTAGTFNFTVTNDQGCTSALSNSVIINSPPEVPAAPTVGILTQPTCSVATGSVELNGLPSSGSWTVTQSPGGITTIGTGSSTTLTGITAGTYTYTVTNVDGCTSTPSSSIVINSQPATPSAPVIGTITQPGCIVSTGSIDLSGLPSSGTWTLTRNPGAITSTGTGSTTTVSGLSEGTYNFTVTNASGCTSGSSSNTTINTAPAVPSAPVVGTTTQPTCIISTGSVSLSGLPGSGTWTLIQNPGGTNYNGTGTSTTILSLSSGTYTYSVTNVDGCTSAASNPVVINAQPPTPSAPVVDVITQPTCSVATGSITLTGLPATGTWTLTRNPGAITSTGTGTSTTISGLSAGTYSFIVTNASGCISVSSSNTVISSQPPSPAAPIEDVDCSLGYGQAIITVLSPTGAGNEYSLDGGAYQSSTIFNNVDNGSYTITVRNSEGCTSTGSTFDVNCGCVNEPVLTLSSSSGSTCGTNQITISENTFGGSATSVSLSHNGTGTVTPVSTSTSPFSFSYLPGVSDAGNTVTITLITNNPNGFPCVAANEVYTLTVNPVPGAPSVSTITQPTCSVSTGSVVLNGLPSGNWTLTRSPGGITTSGSGASTTISGLTAGTYSFTVSNESGCTSPSSSSVIINAPLSSPPSPTQDVDCTLGFRQAVITVLTPLGAEYEYSLDGGTYQTSNIFTDVNNGNHSITVRNKSGCTTIGSSFNISCPCVDGPTLSLSESSGTTCGIIPVTVSGNVFGGNATSVSLSSNGSGVLSPVTTTTSPFAFSYTPSATDAGNTVTITITTDNPLGAPCAAATQTYNLTVYALPSAPAIGTITQPTCSVATGSVAISSLPGIGTWTLTRTPGGVTTTGTGTNTSISGMTTGNYTFTVTNANGCISPASNPVTINSQPPSPETPVHELDCSLGFSQGIVNVLSPTGTGLEYSLDGGPYQSETSFTTVDNGNHSITVRNSSECTTTGNSFTLDCPCVNGPTLNLTSINGNTCAFTPKTISGNTFGGNATSVTITENGAGTITPASTGSSPFSFTYTPAAADAGNTVSITITTNNPLGSPCEEASATYTLQVFAIPNIPTVGTITQPTCSVATGSVVLSGLPSSGTWTLTRNPGSVTTTGTGPSTTISGLSQGNYTFTVTNLNGCTSGPTGSVIINAQPPSPSAPVHTQDCSLGVGNAVIEVTSPTGAGYEYQIDGGTWQSNTTFTGVANGSHTITVRNPSECTATGNSFEVACDCVNGPTISLSSINGSTCGVTPKTVSGNTFGGSATNVSISADGDGTISPLNTSSSPFSFTYTPSVLDFGDVVTITIVTNNPIGSPCEAAVTTYNLTVNQNPVVPAIGTITQPSCNVPTGSVVLNGLPSTGTWELRREPGGATSSGTGNTTTVSGLSQGTYNFTVTSASGCTSGTTSSVTINSQPETPSAPVISSITQPTCSVSTGSVNLTGLPSSGTWIITRLPGGITISGTGTTRTISGLSAGTYSFTVTNAAGCTSASSGNAVVNTQPPTPGAPVIGMIAQPTCGISTGSVNISGLPASGTWTLTRYPGGSTRSGTGTTTTLSGLLPAIYYFTVTNSSGCTSVASTNVVINDQPVTPSEPSIGTIIQPSCDVATGSVLLNDLPSSGTWTINPGGISGTGTTRTISALNPGSYNFTVTNSVGCTSSSSSTVVINNQPQTPSTPVVQNIIQPTCQESTGSVNLNGLPSSGTWVLTRSTGGSTTTGTGTSTTITGLNPGTYTYVVRNSDGCTSGSTPSITINSQPPSPPAPVQEIDCDLGFNFAVVTINNPTGSGYEYSLDGGTFQSSTRFSNIANGSHRITVRNSSGCTTTGASFSVSCGCVNGPSLFLSSISGSTCGVEPFVVSNNSFGGSATSVNIAHDGEGTVEPSYTEDSNFSFTYTPSASDAGEIINIFVTTDNPLGSPCAEASEIFSLTVNPIPASPSISAITDPDCTVRSGSVDLGGLPSTGTWTLARSPGNVTTTGTGTGTTISNLQTGSYTFRITAATGCVSAESEEVLIADPPELPTPPIAGTITPPSCTKSTGSIELTGLPTSGSWILTRVQGGVTQSGNGSDFTIPNLLQGTYNYTITNEDGCTSIASEDITMPEQPEIPDPPIVGRITHPNCESSTGSVALNGLPTPGTWALKRFPGTVTIEDTGTSAIISGLNSGTYNFIVTNEGGCSSIPSENVTINIRPEVPSIPTIQDIIQPTCVVLTGGVSLGGLPEGQNWILIQNPGNIQTVGTGIETIVTELEVGTYSFSVINEIGCTSQATDDINIIPDPFRPEILISDPDPVCFPETVDITSDSIIINSTPGLTFSYWEDEEASQELASPDSVGEGVYFIRGIADDGCFGIGPVTVTVLDIPFAEAGPDQEIQYEFETILDATELGPYETGTWSLQSGNAVIGDTTNAKTLVSDLGIGDNIFMWTVSNEVCPEGQDSVLVKVNDLTIPTLITPNQDGKNDFLVFQGIENLGRTRIIIFDRWGVEVYRNNEYNNDWDGVDQDGNSLPDDTYFYVLSSENGRERSSFIVVRR